jgi:hypothetical protein
MGFELPEDITALSAAELDALVVKVRAYARGVATATPVNAEAVQDATTAFNTVLGEKNARATLAASAAALASSLDETEEVAEGDAEEDEVEGEEVAEVTPPAVVASRKTTKRSTLDTPAPDVEDAAVVMISAPDVPGFAAGQPLTDFAMAGRIIEARLAGYSAPSQRSGSRGIKSGRTSVRHGGVIFRRQFPENLQIRDGDNAYSKVLAAAQEKRLPGGSLVKSAEKLVAAGRSLTAAVGWCAPSEVIYNLCDLSSLDGMLDIPELQASRGGFQLPENGGPDFSTVWNGIGDAGDVILTEYDIENGAVKECFEIPCPPFVDVRLDAAYLCLTGSLLQRRGYPEVIELFSQQAMKALAHKINASVIARIATASGAAIVVPADASGDDAASALLSAIDLAITDAKYAQRASMGNSWEVVLPFWVLVQIRAAFARRYGLGALDLADAAIMNWFAIRKAVPRFVYDWQDAYTGLNTGPGGAVPLTVLPTTVEFLVYPAGTWTKIVQDVVSLDTIYDNALLTTNQYTAIFAEDGFNVIQTCPESRLYRAVVDPSGVVGCCP